MSYIYGVIVDGSAMSFATSATSRYASPCFEFRDFGTCKYGSECRFAHGNGIISYQAYHIITSYRCKMCLTVCCWL
jgi:hypothetical protein